MENLKIYQIAELIRKDWVKISPHARPYLTAMSNFTSIEDRYGFEDARSIILYFLSNAGTWKGDTAKQIKLHLKSLL